MSKAEEIHYKAVMAADNQEPPKDYAISAYADHFNGFVEGYIKGYQQAIEDACEWLRKNCTYTHSRKNTKECAVNIPRFKTDFISEE